MPKRYLYSLLFGLPGLFISGIISILLFGAIAGIFWLFLFGDDPWPPAAQTVISILFVLVFLVLWIAFILLGYWFGRRLENDPMLNRNHVLLSAGLTLLFLLFILLYQWNVGNLGPSSDSVVCSDFCSQHGYSGSGLSPGNSGNRLCSCYDEAGKEGLTIPLDHLDFFRNE
ncbi:MAG TPA: hypothetical protein VK900_05545 [Anaerolineales bacterium]|nr:hypothetical protein [Anaerolineales bacterium]